MKLGVSWEASGLIILAVILATVYFIWLGATVRYVANAHLTNFSLLTEKNYLFT